jgi:cobalt-zinc-cadmium efflux system membrane fusion protein
MKNTIIFMLLVIVLQACGSKETTITNVPNSVVSVENIEVNKSQLANADVTTEVPIEMGIGSVVRVTGTVEVPPQNKTAISFPFGGFVKSVPVLDGMSVKKGQVLVTVEDPLLIELQQDYLEASSQLEYLKQEYDRQKSLGDQQVNSGKTVQQAKSNYMSTLARCKGMKLKLEMAGLSPSNVAQGNLQREVAIRAPFNGMVTKMNAAIGHYVTPQEVLLEIIDLKHCHIELFVFERDIQALKIGQKVHLKLANDLNEKKGTIFLIGKEIGENRMVKVHCHLDNEDPTMIPGSFVNAEIDLSGSKELTVPSDAIVKYNGKDVVFWKTKSSNKGAVFSMKEVTVVGEENGRTAFRYKIAQNNVNPSVVTKGAFAILSIIQLKMQPEE